MAPAGYQKATEVSLRVVVSFSSAHSLVCKCCSGFEVPNHITELLAVEFPEQKLRGRLLNVERGCNSEGFIVTVEGGPVCIYRHAVTRLVSVLNALYNSLHGNCGKCFTLGANYEYPPIKETGASHCLDQGSASHSLKVKSSP